MANAPTISISGVIVTVSVVEGAMGYRLYVDNSMIKESIENEFDLSVILDGYPIGSYTITATGYFDNDIDPITETAQSNAIIYKIEEPEPVETEKYTIKKSTLSGIADAIRSKTGKTEQIDAANFASEIESIETGGNGMQVNCGIPNIYISQKEIINTSLFTVTCSLKLN